MISRLECLSHKVFFFFFFLIISSTYPPSSDAWASSCFDFSFLLFAPDSYCRSEAISPPASDCLSAHLTADWSDAACCQSLRQRVRCQITRLFCLGLTLCSTRASLQRCASFAHLQRVGPLCKMGSPMDHGFLRTARVLRVGMGGTGITLALGWI